MSNIFRRVGSLRPSRSAFDLSHEVKLTCDMGQLIPVLCEEMVPGDTFKIGNSIIIRFQPLVAPIMHEINVYVHYFFVPYRLLWPDWEDFITGGVDGEFSAALPTWDPGPSENDIGTLWDYFGFPTDVNPVGAFPLDFPRRAYNFIYNEYYRDETLIDEVPLTNALVLNRCWEKDYFASALPWQQRGTAPALPISGLTSAVFDFTDPGAIGSVVQTPNVGALGIENPPSFVGDVTNGATVFSNPRLSNYSGWTASAAGLRLKLGSQSEDYLNDSNTVDLSAATTFNVSDLRLVFQIQKWLERNARAGARYTEFLGAHFGVHPRDDRLQRPEYIGGSKSNVIVSEVLQTSSTDGTSPQGNQAGHAISGSATFAGSYTAQEFGLVMGIMSVMPRAAYQQGIDRQWLRRTKYDFYFPEFANLSEQAIERAEIFASGVEAENKTIFGYQGRYDEMRVKRSRVAGLMRTTLDYWHLGRQFVAAPELNENFLKCVPRKDIFAVQDEPGLIVNFGNIIKAIRPMPISAEPGLIDHN